MATIQFYHLTTTPLERALPKLLEKAYGANMRALVVAPSDERAEQLNQLLWSYDPGSFLPHGSMKEPSPEAQPILLTANSAENKNGATALFITNGAMPAEHHQYERILDIFDGNDAQAVENARVRWASYKTAGHTLTYLRQNEAGGWEQKAVA